MLQHEFSFYAQASLQGRVSRAEQGGAAEPDAHVLVVHVVGCEWDVGKQSQHGESSCDWS